MEKIKTISSLFDSKSLRFQFLIVIATLLLIPVLVILYDIFFASRSDEAMLKEREEKLGSVIETVVIPEIQKNIDYYMQRDQLQYDTLNPVSKASYLREAFDEATRPLVLSNLGVRFGLYIPETGQIYVQGFLHQYRAMDPSEKVAREERIKEEAKSGLIAVAASGQTLSRLTSSLDDETYEYLMPVYIDGQLTAVAWADERIHPIFAQSRHFRAITRYLTLFAVLIGATGALFVIHNLSSSVTVIKRGLGTMEKDIQSQIPTLAGEPGEIAKAINRMAISLAEKEKLEEELRRSERLAALGRLVTGVAHELRNPIGIIKTTVQLMEKDLEQADVDNECFKIIEEQIERQNRVIQELLDFGRPSKHMVQSANINSLLEKVLIFTLPMLRQHSIKLEKMLTQELPFIEVDAERIKQVFVNINLNAVQAMPEGGKLIICTGHDSDWVNISFIDTGSGISPSEVASIFDPFYTTREYGTGLGLSISHQIIKTHDGHINVDSTLGAGTKFTVNLPLSTKMGGDTGGS